jgi:hypothetical protein
MLAKSHRQIIDSALLLLASSSSLYQLCVVGVRKIGEKLSVWSTTAYAPSTEKHNMTEREGVREKPATREEREENMQLQRLCHRPR